MNEAARRRSDSEEPTRASAATMLARLLGFVKPYVLPLIAVTVFTLIFSAGRFGRAYLMKPLLDGVLLPVAAGTEPAPTGSAKTRSDWLSTFIAEILPAEQHENAATSNEAAEGEARGKATRDIDGVRETFRGLLLAGLLIVVVTPIALLGRVYLTEYALGRVDVDIKQRMAAKLLALPLAKHQREKSGDILSRTFNDAGAARAALRLVFQELLLGLVMIVIGLLTLVYISWPLTLISLGAAPIIIGVLTVFGERIRKSARRRQEQLGEVTQRLINILSGIKVIKAFAGEKMEGDAFARETRKLFRHDMRVVRNRVLSRAVVEALNSGAGIALLALGSILVLRGHWGLTTGDVAAFATVLATTYRPVKNLSKGYTRMMENLASTERFFKVLDAAEEPSDAPGAARLDGVQASIRFDNVSLGYPDDAGDEQMVLRHVSLEVFPGEVVAIVGRTGAGKTTLMDLLLRFYDPSAGSIHIDGRDLREIARKSLHEQVAVVTQDPFLFDTTIRENIRYGRPEATDDEVREAACTAHVDEFVDHLPLGYDTRVGEFGMRLSGGQRQRITIARALLKRPAILIFDEATSALDAKTERTVQDAIDGLRGERTIFLVAHRLSTIQRADRIVVLEDGAISQSGRHEDLLAAEGLYRELASLQRTPEAP